MTPEMEVIEIKSKIALLAGSNGESSGGTDDPEEL